jgi:SPP1 gp7 family putative phage head morphogenesis protein
MSELYTIADRYRAALLRRDEAAQSRLLAEYARVFSRILRQLARLNQKIEDARARGETVDFAWLLRQERYAELLSQVDEEFRKFATFTEKAITQQQADAVQSAIKDSQRLMSASADAAGVSATFNRLPPEAVSNLVGFLSDGSPLAALLSRFGPTARQKAEGVLIEAVALGRNPRAIQTALAEALGTNRRRALTIARTETIRAYREASHRSFQEDSDVLEGWYWLASKSSRTCAACLALDGTFHELGERMKSHVSCRCTAIPAIKGMPSPITETGSQWFAKQDAKTQADILGSKAAAESYRRGDLRLEDFVGLKRDPRWGDSYHQIGLRRALAGEGAFPGDAAKTRNNIPETISPTPKPPTRPPLTAAEARRQILDLHATNKDADAKAIADTTRRITDAEAEFIRQRDPIAKAQALRRVREAQGDLAQLKESLLEKYREPLYQDAETKVKPDVRYAFAKEDREAINRGVEAFRRFIGEKTFRRGTAIEITFAPKGRALFDAASQFVRLPDGAPVHVVVHELAHWLEDNHKGIFDEITAFLDRRTAGEQAESLNALTRSNRYRADERAKPDKFIIPYAGKQYYAGGSRLASEVLSMGLEWFYSDPVGFAEKDPDMFEFIYTILRKHK